VLPSFSSEDAALPDELEEGEEGERVKKWSSLIRNLTNGILDILLADDESTERGSEEMAKGGGGGEKEGEESVFFAQHRAFFFKPQLGYLM
jgi:hypothetical protein